MRATAGLAFALALGCTRPEVEGQRIFEGERALVARLEGDDAVLPVGASRCANCHLPVPPADSAAATTQLFGPVLDRALLLQARARRGGPPSRYDATSFCALLRTGLDPARVLIARTMPRYQVDDRACRALWVHLTR